jgi:drug/metabolite transporter (DMT)-like permease
MTSVNQNKPGRKTISVVAANEGRFELKDWLLFLGVSLVWGSSFLLIDITLESMEPGVITFGRVSLGALALVVVSGLANRSGPLWPEPSDRLGVAALSALWVAVPFTLFPLAQQYINSALTGLLNGATPIYVAIAGMILARVRPRGFQLAGTLVGFLGVVLISAPTLTTGGSQVRGVLMVLGATACYGVAMNVASPLQRRYGSVSLMRWMLIGASLWTLPFGLLHLPESEVQTNTGLALLVLGVVGTGVAYLMMATLVGRVGPTRASFITYLIPVVALVLGVVFREDSVEGLALVGVALVVSGAFLASRSQS